MKRDRIEERDLEKVESQPEVEEPTPEEEVVVPEPVVETPQEPVSERVSLTQFCTSISDSSSVELLSVFYEVELEKRHYMGTYEEYLQRFQDLKEQPL